MNKNAKSSLLIIVLLLLTGCGQSVKMPDYMPVSDTNLEIFTQREEGLDTALCDKMYLEAEKNKTITSLLILKNGKLIAEKYYNDGAPDKYNRIQSVTKSFVSALAGIAIDKGFFTLDTRMIEFFPELRNMIKDERKNDITVRHLLMMRAGYPWEESTTELFEMLYNGFRPSLLVDVPLVYAPGTDMEYSNLSSHLLGVIISRATGQDLMSFATDNLFNPIGIVPGEWTTDWEGNNNGHADLYLTSDDMARFGLLYLNNGLYDGVSVIPEEWISDSLDIHSYNAWDYRVGKNVAKMAYGYQWWSADAGGYRYSFAWGHGGQQIALVPELDMVIVVTADPLVGQHGDKSWKYERQNLNLIGNFIAALPLKISD